MRGVRAGDNPLMGKRAIARICGFSLLVLVGAWGMVALDFRAPRAPGPIVVEIGGGLAEARLLAGAMVVDLTPEEPMPLGGYSARLGRRHEEVRDEVHGRVLILESLGPEKERAALALVSLDTVLIPPGLADALRDRARRDLPELDEVFVAATHTHAGPGGTWDSRIAGAFGMGGYRSDYGEAVVESVGAAIARAWEIREQVSLRELRAEGPSICRGSDQERQADLRLGLLSLEGKGEEVARAMVFACHPTFLGHGDMRVSAEWPGETMRRLSGTTLFLQGAVGDQRPAWASPRLRAEIERVVPGLNLDDPEGRMVAAGALVADAVEGLEASLPSVATGPAPADSPGLPNHPVAAGPATAESSISLTWATTRVSLPLPTGEHVAPFGLRSVTGKLLSRIAPEQARISLLRLGETVLIFVPGEVVSELAMEWESEVSRLTGLEHVRVVSLVDGYFGYFETAEALYAGTAESSNSWYGPEAAERIGAAQRELAEAIRAPVPSSE